MADTIYESGTSDEDRQPPRLDAVIALYSAERADNQNTLTQALALVSILIAYAAGVGAVIATKPEVLEEKAYLALALPFPIYAALGFHLLLNGLVFSHNLSIEALEDILRGAAGLKDQEWIGAAAGRSVTDIGQLWHGRRIPLGVATVLSYFGTAVIIGTITIVCVKWPVDQLYALGPVIAAAAFYIVIIGFLVWGWLVISQLEVCDLR